MEKPDDASREIHDSSWKERFNNHKKQNEQHATWLFKKWTENLKV